MRKAFFKQSAGLLCALALAASAADKTVTNKELGFEITFPETWTLQKKPAAIEAVKGESPRIAGAQATSITRVVVTDVKEGITSKAFAELLTAGESKDFNNYVFIDQGEIKLNDSNAFKRTFEYEPVVTKRRVTFTSYYFVAGKRGYVIDIGVSNVDSALYAKDFDAIVKSFKLLPAK
jgi:hypothetical protein